MFPGFSSHALSSSGLPSILSSPHGLAELQAQGRCLISEPFQKQRHQEFGKSLQSTLEW